MGIDPGIAIVGFGVIDSDRGKQSYVRCGVITTPAGTSLSSRLDRIYADMGEVIRTFKPDVAAIEELFFNTNITTGISVAQGRGVILLACYHAGLCSLFEIFEFSVNDRQIVMSGCHFQSVRSSFR